MGEMVPFSIAAGLDLGGMMASDRMAMNENEDTAKRAGLGPMGTINSMNTLLQKALVDALDVSGKFTDKAIGEQRYQLGEAINALQTGLSGATGAVNKGLFNANQAANTSTNRGLINSGILQAPYSSMGLNAADAYADSLGISRPTMGSANLQNSIFQYQALKPEIEKLQAAAKTAGMTPFELQQFTQQAPTAPTLFNVPQMNITPDQVQALISQNIKSTFVPYIGDVAYWGGSMDIPGLKPGDNIGSGQAHLRPGLGGRDPSYFLNNPGLKQWATEQLTNQYNNQWGSQIAQNQAMTNQYNTDMNNYNTALNNYNAYSGLFNNMSNTIAGINPNVLRNAISAGNSMFARGV